jgi:hypothetical protein
LGRHEKSVLDGVSSIVKAQGQDSKAGGYAGCTIIFLRLCKLQVFAVK